LPPAMPTKPGKKSRRRWITSAESRAEVQRMRHASDALLTGIGTVLADDPLLTDRTGLPRRRRLLRVVLDSRLRLSPRARLGRSAHDDVLVFTCAPDAGGRTRALRRAGVEVISLPGRGGKPDLPKVLAELGRRGILSVLLEAGVTLNQAALLQGLVDKARLFYAPILVGGERQQAPLALSRVRLEHFGPDIAVEGYLHDVYRR
jgi:diaminohydroxyphosphoribosylaminopyrimidine deaminase/5-amino-6-(5-phosphoribosylamino)uracil reductase